MGGEEYSTVFFYLSGEMYSICKTASILHYSTYLPSSPNCFFFSLNKLYVLNACTNKAMHCVCPVKPFVVVRTFFRVAFIDYRDKNLRIANLATAHLKL